MNDFCNTRPDIGIVSARQGFGSALKSGGRFRSVVRGMRAVGYGNFRRGEVKGRDPGVGKEWRSILGKTRRAWRIGAGFKVGRWRFKKQSLLDLQPQQAGCRSRPILVRSLLFPFRGPALDPDVAVVLGRPIELSLVVGCLAASTHRSETAQNGFCTRFLASYPLHVAVYHLRNALY